MQRITVYITVALSALLVGTLILSMPYIVSAIFFYEGEMSLNRALEAQGIDRANWDIMKTAGTNSTLSALATAQAEQAATYLQRAVVLDKNNGPAHHSLIQTYLLLGDVPSALVAFKQLDAVAPGDRDLVMALGNASAAAGDMRTAVSVWQKADARLSPEAVQQLTINPSLRLRAADLLPSRRGGAATLDTEQGQVVVIFTDDIIESPLLFLEGGTYTVRVQALNGKPPPIQLDISLDDQYVASLAYLAGDSSWGVQEATFSVQKGLHWLGLRFANDYYASPTDDRNATVEWIEISRK